MYLSSHAFRLQLAAACLLSATAFTSLARAQVPGDHTVLVVGREEAAIHELATGKELARIPVPGGNLDAVALANGIALFNHTAGHQVVVIDLKSTKEIARIPSSALGGTRPVHSYLSPAIDGRQYYVALNDGVAANIKPGEKAVDSTLTLIDVVPASATYLKPVGETRLGAGHHKVAFSTKRARMVVSNISDCQDVLSVYDFSDPAVISLVKSYGAPEFGFDGSTAAKTCDLTGKTGVALSPHGVGTSAATGEVYHFITGTGQVAVLDIDAEQPVMKLIQTAGSGGSTTKDMPGGRYIVVPQRTPREAQDRANGILCQIGQLAVIDAQARKLVAQTPILNAPGCTQSIQGKPASAASPAYIAFTPDGRTMFMAVGTLGGAANAPLTYDAVPVFDMSEPTAPKQLASIPVEPGKSRDVVIAGGGKLLLVPNSSAASVSVIDMAARKVVSTFKTVAEPSRLASFSPTQGPSKPVGPASPAAY